jgi:histidine phosphotransferase ChpT
MSLDARLARTLCARLCHDLGGAVGTLAGTLDLAGEHGGEMLALSQETATVLRQRLRLYTAAWGGPGGEADAAGLAGLLEGAPAWPRVRFALDRLAPGTMLPAPVVPLALNAALLAAEALPRGGTVVLSGSAEVGLVAWPDGLGATWPAPLLPLLGGTPPGDTVEGGPRRILGPLLLALAAEAGWEVSLGLASGDGVPPLTLMPSRT